MDPESPLSHAVLAPIVSQSGQAYSSETAHKYPLGSQLRERHHHPQYQ